MTPLSLLLVVLSLDVLIKGPAGVDLIVVIQRHTACQRSQNNSVVNLLYGSFYEGVGSSVFRIVGNS